MFTVIAAVAASGLLMKFFMAVLLLAVIGGLLYCIDYFIYPIPGPIKLVIAIIVLIVIVMKFLGGGGL
jgi:hypothetical protein